MMKEITTPPKNQWEPFLKALYDGTEYDLELRALPSKAQLFTKYSNTEQIEKFTKDHIKENLYFGVSTREGQKGDKEATREVPALWVDIDFKDFPGGEEEAKEFLGKTLNIPTSAVVHSGNGYHLYWFFKEPEEASPEIEAYLKGLAKRLRGDIKAPELARILRIPGTSNYKDGGKKPVRLIKLDSNLRYNLSDFEDFKDDTPVSDAIAHTVNVQEITDRCAFLKYCHNNRATLTEPLWFAMVSNVARISPGGPDLVHALSHGHPGYSKNETDRKILHALNGAGPHTCQYIKDTLDCGKDCHVKAPIGLFTERVNKEAEAKELEEPETPEESLVFPDSAWRGVFGTYLEAVKESTWASKVTHFITLWAVIAALLRRKVKFHYGLDLYPNGQFYYYGETNDKKTTATSKFKAFLADNPHVKVLQGIGSGEGLTDWLKPGDTPTSHFIYLSELSELLQKGKWEGATLKTVLTHIYDCPEIYEAPFRKDPIKIKEPTVTLLACTTPTWFWKDVTELDIHGGFANRMLPFTGDPGEPIARPQRPDTAQINRIRNHIEEAIKALPADTLELDFDPEAAKLWDAFYPEWIKEKWPTELVSAGVKRVDGYIIKLSMVYAVMEGTPCITYDQLKAAIEVGYYSAKCTERLISKHQLKSRAGRLEERIINQLEQGTNTRRQLQKSAGTNFDCTVFNKTLDSMVRANRIYERAGKRSNTWEYSLR